MEHDIRMLMDVLDQIAFIRIHGYPSAADKLAFLANVRDRIWERITTLYYALRDGGGPSLR